MSVHGAILWKFRLIALGRFLSQDMLAERELSVMSFQHVLDLSARYHNQKKSGEVLNVL